MKNRLRSYWTLMCCGFLLISGNCKAGTDSLTALIDIVVHDRDLLKDAVIEFELHKKDINSKYVKDMKYLRAELVDSITRFTISLSTPLNYGRIIFSSGKLREISSPVNLHYDNNLFLFEHGDTIQVHLYPKRVGNVVFTGNRGNKYTALYEINNNKRMDNQTHREINNLLARNNTIRAFERTQIWADSLNRELNRTLIEMDSSLSPDIRKLVFLDNSAYTHNVIRTKMEIFIENEESDVDVLSMFHSILSEPVFEERSLLYESFAALSHEWCDMLLFNERLRSRIACILADGGACNITSIGKALARRYKGPILDKLSYLVLLRNLDSDGFIERILHKADGNREDNRYRIEARSFMNRSQGSPAYNFEMIDSHGTWHKLSDYRGKVIVIDFWFTGCMACMNLAKRMSEVVEFYGDSNDVVFISLNVDRYSDVWKQSLTSGAYTHENGLNLWAGEVGTKHPILAHYGIQGFPMVLIVDKDGVLVKKHVNQLFTKDNTGAAEDFIRMVESYR